MNLEKLKKLENKVRIGGKKSPRRKVLKNRKTNADQAGNLNADPVLHADSVVDALDQEILDQIEIIEQELETKEEKKQEQEEIIEQELEQKEEKKEEQEEDLFDLYTSTEQDATLEAQVEEEETLKQHEEDLVVGDKQEIHDSHKDQEMEHEVEIFTSNKDDASRDKKNGLKKLKEWITKVFRKKQRI
jgi:hypothetical protein